MRATRRRRRDARCVRKAETCLSRLLAACTALVSVPRWPASKENQAHHFAYLTTDSSSGLSLGTGRRLRIFRGHYCGKRIAKYAVGV